MKAVLTSVNTAFLPYLGHVSRNAKSLCLVIVIGPSIVIRGEWL